MIRESEKGIIKYKTERNNGKIEIIYIKERLIFYLNLFYI